MMRNEMFKLLPISLVLVMLGLAGQASAQGAYVQCPGDNPSTSDAVVLDPTSNVQCMHLTAGDGFVRMADDAGTVLYTFGFGNRTGTPESQAIEQGILGANFPAPLIMLDQGKEFYLTLTNVGTIMRPDLADPHTVHFHGFPNASSVFDGVPDASIAINNGASLTYYYNVDRPGTYMYHCHVEAAEHMQMGMLGNLYVRPGQNGTDYEYPSGSGRHYTKFVYNDGDGSTGYDVEVPIQIGSFDSNFHELHLAVQPLPFANMRDTFPMLNGRGYPDTVNPGALAPPDENGGIPSQQQSALVTATVGQKILLRISNLNVTRYYTLAVNGLSMRVIGIGASQMVGPDGKDISYLTNSITLGGGEATDVIIDTTGVQPGTYFLYTTHLNYLSNYEEDYGGMMTEIRISTAL